MNYFSHSSEPNKHPPPPHNPGMYARVKGHQLPIRKCFFLLQAMSLNCIAEVASFSEEKYKFPLQNIPTLRAHKLLDGGGEEEGGEAEELVPT